jgi:uncharacterized membrane protein YbhN (UPF0104 family)
MASSEISKRRSRLKIVVRAGALMLSLGFLAALVGSQWQELRAYEWTLQPGWLALSYVALAGAWLLELSVWRFILASLGGALRWRRAAETWFLAGIVRYIPGNVWQFLGMAELAADDGVSRITTLTSIALLQILGTAVGIMLAAVYFAVAGQGAWLEALRPFLLLVPLGLLLCHPRLLEWGLNWIMRLLKRPPVQVTLTWGQIWMILVAYVGVWLLMGSGFALLAGAVVPITPQQFGALVATWAAAFVIGYLSMLTPGGLGVREGVMILLLAPVFAAPVPTMIALLARLWMVGGELVGAGLALISRSRDRWQQERQGEAGVPLGTQQVEDSQA